MAPPDSGRSVNPKEGGGTDYAHQMTLVPRIFRLSYGPDRVYAIVIENSHRIQTFIDIPKQKLLHGAFFVCDLIILHFFPT